MPLTVSSFPRTTSPHFSQYNQIIVLSVPSVFNWHVSCDLTIEQGMKAVVLSTKFEPDKGGYMRRILGLLIATIMLIACSGCFVGWENDRGGHEGHEHGDHHGDRHDDRGGHDEHH